MDDVCSPTFVQIEPVGQCNLRCRMCSIQFRADEPADGTPSFMSPEVFYRLIEDLPKLQRLHLQGLGEPLLHPRFFDMVAYAVNKGIRVSTNTNITMLTTQKAEMCLSSGLHEIHVSLDGASAEVFEYIRVKASFSKVIRNLTRLMQIRRNRGDENLSVRLIMVIMKQNLHELPQLVDLAKNLGIQSIFVQHLCHDFKEGTLPGHYSPMRDFVDDQSLISENELRIQYYFENAATRAEELGIDLRLPRPRPLGNQSNKIGRERCDWPWTGPYISYQGYVMPCCMVSTPDRINFGNAIEHGINDIWVGNNYTDFRQSLASDHPPHVCQSCSLYHGVF